MARTKSPPNAASLDSKSKPSGGVRSRQENYPNLVRWAKGVSGNPNGRAGSINQIMRLARSYCPEAIEKLIEIVRDSRSSRRDQIAACLALLDRGLGRPVVPIFRGSSSGLPDDMIMGTATDGSEMTALLAAAQPGDTYKQTLQSELKRIEAEERQAKADRKDEINEAAARMERGEEVSPLMRMLVTVKKETS